MEDSAKGERRRKEVRKKWRYVDRQREEAELGTGVNAKD